MSQLQKEAWSNPLKIFKSCAQQAQSSYDYLTQFMDYSLNITRTSIDLELHVIVSCKIKCACTLIMLVSFSFSSF